MLFVILYSIFFVAIKTSHECIGEECQTCYQIELCVKSLKTMPLVIVIVAGVVVKYILSRDEYPCLCSVEGSNLTSLKIKKKVLRCPCHQASLQRHSGSQHPW